MSEVSASRIVLSPSPLEGITEGALRKAWIECDEFLARVPGLFGLDAVGFCETLSHRNVSGFVGEVFKHSLSRETSGLVLNPHPDGRPDLLDVKEKRIADYFWNVCHDVGGAPLRSRLAPFAYGGIEVKATLGEARQGVRMPPVGESRASQVVGINFWAHHAHACRLLGLYYDFCDKRGGAPQVKAIFLANIDVEDWNRVSRGSASRKKTSNTSLNANGKAKLKSGLVAFDSAEPYRSVVRRLTGRDL